jgi:paraquat-inducible protein A
MPKASDCGHGLIGGRLGEREHGLKVRSAGEWRHSPGLVQRLGRFTEYTATALNPTPLQDLKACPRCGLVQRIEVAPAGWTVRCTRCGSRVVRPRSNGRASRAAAFALGALILYPAAMVLPVLEIQKLGHRRSATIWTGAVDLLSGGQIAVGLLVFVCSIVVPVLKVGGVFALCTGLLRGHHGARAHRFMEWIGRWGMIDVLLVAVLVAAVKLGSWVDVHPGPGVAAFAAVVVLSLLASAQVDPARIWEGVE